MQLYIEFTGRTSATPADINRGIAAALATFAKRGTTPSAAYEEHIRSIEAQAQAGDVWLQAELEAGKAMTQGWSDPAVGMENMTLSLR